MLELRRERRDRQETPRQETRTARRRRADGAPKHAHPRKPRAPPASAAPPPPPAKPVMDILGTLRGECQTCGRRLCAAFQPISSENLMSGENDLRALQCQRCATFLALTSVTTQTAHAPLRQRQRILR